MDLRYPITGNIDDILRHGISGAILLSLLWKSFPDFFCSNWFTWHYFVIFSFVIGFLLYALSRFFVDLSEEKKYYEGVVGSFIQSRFGYEKLKVNLLRAFENYYFWRYNRRADLSKIHRRASYIYFYLSMSLVFLAGTVIIPLSLISHKEFCWILAISPLSGIMACFFFHKYRKTWEDQLYLLKITFLNVLNDTTSFLEKKKSREEKEELQCFEDFVEYVIRVNNFNRIKKDGKEEKIISEL